MKKYQCVPLRERGRWRELDWKIIVIIPNTPCARHYTGQEGQGGGWMSKVRDRQNSRLIAQVRVHMLFYRST